MSAYLWTPTFLSVLEEHDRIKLQKKIASAKSEIMARHSELRSSSDGTAAQREEFERLCDARRILDLLKHVSSDGAA